MDRLHLEKKRRERRGYVHVWSRVRIILGVRYSIYTRNTLLMIRQKPMSQNSCVNSREMEQRDAWLEAAHPIGMLVGLLPWMMNSPFPSCLIRAPIINISALGSKHNSYYPSHLQKQTIHNQTYIKVHSSHSTNIYLFGLLNTLVIGGLNKPIIYLVKF